MWYMKGPPSAGSVSLRSILTPISADANEIVPCAFASFGSSAEYMAIGGLTVIIGAGEAAFALASLGGRGHSF